MTDQTVITCLCGKINQPGGGLIASSTLPVERNLCHCNLCRYVTGVLAASFVPLAKRPDQVEEGRGDSLMAAYDTSPKITRYFCKTCGAHCFLQTHPEEKWFACSGVVEYVETAASNEDEGGQHGKPVSGSNRDIVRIIGHTYVGDTVDGGIAGRLTRVGGRHVPCYAEGPKGEEMQLPGSPIQSASSPTASTTKSGGGAGNDKFHARCHCGGVQFYVPRPKTEPDSETSPSLSSKWWTREQGTKYLAKTCVCRSCRLASGQPLHPWTYVPKRNILNLDESPLHLFTFHQQRKQDSDLSSSSSPTLQSFLSSPGVSRHFCGRCGATVFFEAESRGRPSPDDDGPFDDVVDISVGLLRAPEGSRADDWLGWVHDDVNCRLEARDREVVDALCGGGSTVEK